MNKSKGHPSQSDRRRGSRFQQLFDLAHGGDETTIHDLWVEYHFDFQKEGSAHE